MTQATRFEEFATHEEEIVASASKLLVEARTAYESGDISKSEFEELAEDVLEIGQVDALGDNVERKAAALQAFRLLMTIVKAIP